MLRRRQCRGHDVVELGKVVNQAGAWARGDDNIILYKAIGVGLEVTLAEFIHRRLTSFLAGFSGGRPACHRPRQLFNIANRNGHPFHVSAARAYLACYTEV